MTIPVSVSIPDAHSRAVGGLRTALELLSRASADWRNGDCRGSAALHWPVAITLARSELRNALKALDECGEESGRPPRHHASDCSGPVDEDTDDARAGLAWYNGATVAERRHWHLVARSAVPADAWEAYKSEGAQP